MAVPKVSGLNCPNCGAAIELRSFTNAITVVCQQCLSVLDAKDPNLQILQQAQTAQRIEPAIPLGSRGTLSSGTFEAIGFQVRTTYEEGEAYSWSEYLLFNPYKGFRYLTEYNGHWNDVRTLNTLPQILGSSTVKVADTSFKLYSNSMAETTYVLGEFPWQVKVGEKVQVTDYVAAPKVLSAETTPEEVVWSMGDYISGDQVWKAFKLTTPVPPAYGTFENQPSPYTGTVASIWGTSLKLAAAAVVVALLIYATAGRRVVYKQSFVEGAPSTAAFEVPGHRSNLQVKTINRTGQPLYVQYSLIAATGKTVNFGRQVRSSSEGDTAVIPSVDPGHYTLHAEGDTPGATPASGSYDVELRRDVPSLSWLVGALALLLLPPIFHSWRAMNFERSRWIGSST